MRSEKEKTNPFILVSCYGCHGLTLTELILQKTVSSGRGGKKEELGEDKGKTKIKERWEWDQTVRPRGRAQLEDNVRTQD